MFRRAALPTVAAVMAVIVGFGAPVAAASSTTAAPGSTGHDVSYPQCSSSGSSSTTVTSLGGAFGIVGVTDGLPWSTNSCLASEYRWASGLSYEPALYTNTANPAPHSSFFWPASGSSSPVLCKDSTSTTDPGCAYDYGWHAAQNALSTATASVGASSLPWYLDVEAGNSWNGDGSANAADLQGFVDYLRGQGVPSVGIYSSASAWSAITGGYTVDNAASYQSAWSSEFSPAYPMYQSPTWVAGAGSSATASSTCGAATFTGTLPQLAQFKDGTGYDADLVCGTPPQQSSFVISLSPGSGTVAQGGSTTATVSVNESGPSQSVTLSSTGQPSGVTVSFSPGSVSASGSVTMTVKVGAGASPGTYPLSITGTGTSGTSIASYSLTVTTQTRRGHHGG